MGSYLPKETRDSHPIMHCQRSTASESGTYCITFYVGMAIHCNVEN